MDTINFIPFIYKQTATLTALGSSVVTLNLHPDSNFQLESFTAVSDQQGADDTNPDFFSVSLMDVTTGRQLTNTRVRQSLLCGNAFHTIWRQRRDVRFLPQSQIRFDFLNLVNATNVVEFCLHGYKLFL